MALVYLKNKINGITYVYESENYWDKDKQQSRSRRTCVGKLDPQKGALIPSKRLSKPTLPSSFQPDPTPVAESKRHYAGATFLLDAIGDKLGITADLKQCFPEQYKQVLSVAYYLILEDHNPLIRFPKWAFTHKHPYGKDIPSQRSSELFASITEDGRERYLRLQGKRRVEKEYWAYDTTTISSYSECLNQVKYGVNKEHDPIPQMILALLFGEQSNLPFYYRKLPGISDVQTVKSLIADMDFLDYKKIKLVMDRGFYSEANINALFQHHLKFLVGVKVSLKYVQSELETARTQLQKWESSNPDYNLFAHTRAITWKYTQHRPYKGDVLEGERRAYLHLYFNKEKEAEDAMKLSRLLTRLKHELESGKRDPAHEKAYAKYFEVKSTPKRGVVVKPKQEAIDAAAKNYGYFALLSNEIKDPIEALAVYRNKDLIEKAFGNLKERQNFRRMEVSSERSLDGKLFVEFVALIYLSYIKKEMQEKKLFERYTMQGLLDELDVIECYERQGHDLRFGEITKRQMELYELLGVTPPSS